MQPKQKRKITGKWPYSPRLPPEIRMQIIAYITDEHTQCVSCSFGTLFSLSLVTREWNSSANYTLYYHLRLDRLSIDAANVLCRRHSASKGASATPGMLPLAQIQPESADWAHNKLADGTDIAPAMFRKLALLLGSLQRYQHIADTIHTITVNGDCMLSNCTAGIISACDNLEYVRRDEDFFTGIARPILQQAVTIPSLGGNDWEDVVNMLERQRLDNSPPSSSIKRSTVSSSRGRKNSNTSKKGPLAPNEGIEGRNWLECERARRIEDSKEVLRLPEDVFMLSIATRSHMKSIELTYTLGKTPYPATYPLPTVVKAEQYYPLERWYCISTIEEAQFVTSPDLSDLGSWNHDLNNGLRKRCEVEVCKHISNFLLYAKSLKQLKLEARPEVLMELLKENISNMKSLTSISLFYNKFVGERVPEEVWALLKSVVENGMLPKVRKVECLVGNTKKRPDSKSEICHEVLEYHQRDEHNTIFAKIEVSAKRIRCEPTGAER